MTSHTDFTKDDKVESLISSIIGRKDYSGKRYLTRYDKEWLIEMLNGDKLSHVESNFKEYDKKGVDIVDFVKIMLSSFDHKQEETIYIVLALIDLFKGICESMNIKEFVRFQDFTTFIVENLIDKGNNEYILQSKKLPEQTRFTKEMKGIREIDLNPPMIYGKNQLGMKRILADKILTDSSHHENGEIKCAAYSHELKKLFTLDALSNVIKVYGKDCKKDQEIIPKASKDNKDLIIISFSYSEFTQRIGACLKNFTLSFWDASDDFKFEKTINTSLVASDYQMNIWYIDFLQSWATADKTGALHIWDISINKVKHSYYMASDSGKGGNKDKKGASEAAKKKREKARMMKSQSVYTLNSKVGSIKKTNPDVSKNQFASIDDLLSMYDSYQIPSNGDKNSIGGQRNKEASIKGKKIRRSKKSKLGIKSKKSNKLSNKRLERDNYVIDLAEIGYLKIVITASTDKQIRIWDMRNENKAKVLFCLNMVKGGVHQIKYFNDYQVLLVAGYENSIPVFNITPEYYDLTVVGRLVGHLSIVTAINYLSNSPMVISADDNGCIKTWDIRSLQCYQTIELSHRTVINNLIPMSNIGKVSFIGCRVNFLEFDTYEMKMKKGLVGEKMAMYPIRVDVNMDKEELIICTRSDLRFFNLRSGRLKKIFTHLISSEEVDELTEFRLIQKNHKFLLSDHKGSINIYNYASGERINKLEPHQSEITGMRIDNFNKLFVTAGNDSVIKIQRELLGENKLKEIKMENDDIEDEFLGMGPMEILKKINNDRQNEFKRQSEERRLQKKQEEEIKNIKTNEGQNREVLRTITKVHRKNKVTLLCLSVYHNLIASASTENEVIIYDYEFCRLVGRVSFGPGVDATALEFINGYAILMIATNDFKLYFVDVTTRDINNIDIELVGMTDPNYDIQKFHLNSHNLKMDKIRELKEKYKDEEEKKAKKAYSIFDIKDDMDKKYEFTNPYEEAERSFVDRIHIDMNLSEEVDDAEINDIQYENAIKNIKVEQCLLVLALNSGFIVIYEIKNFISKQNFRQHANRRPNYNPYRLATEDYVQQIETNSLNELNLLNIDKQACIVLDEHKIDHFYAHKSNLTSIKVVKIPNTYILTTSSDRYCKIFKITGELVAAININHPLPLLWGLDYDKLFDTRNKVLFGLKVIESIFKRYYNMLYMEGKVFDLKAFLDQYRANGDKDKDGDAQEENCDGNLFNMTGVKIEKKKEEEKRQDQIIVMQDEYKPKDFAIGKISEFYRQELTGPNLKQMEAKRRIIEAHEEWKLNLEKYKNLMKKMGEAKPEDQITPFMDDFMPEGTAFHEEDDKYSKEVSEFVKKMNKVKQDTDISEICNNDLQTLTARENKRKFFHFLRTQESQKKTMKADPLKAKKRFLPKKPAPENKLMGLEFYGYANSKNLLDSSLSTAFSAKKPSKPIVTDIDHKMIRKQNATKERNFERNRFGNVLTNLKSKLKKNQLVFTKNRNMSLPQLKQLNKEVDMKMKNIKSGYMFGRRNTQKSMKKHRLSQKSIKSLGLQELTMSRKEESIKIKRNKVALAKLDFKKLKRKM